MDVSSKPNLFMLNQYFKIIKSTYSQHINVFRDDQTRQLKLSSSQKNSFIRG
jgi:hypothetical protein